VSKTWYAFRRSRVVVVILLQQKVQCLSAVCVNAMRSGDDIESDEFVGQSFMLAERRLKSENNEGIIRKYHCDRTHRLARSCLMVIANAEAISIHLVTENYFHTLKAKIPSTAKPAKLAS